MKEQEAGLPGVRDERMQRQSQRVESKVFEPASGDMRAVLC